MVGQPRAAAARGGEARPVDDENAVGRAGNEGVVCGDGDFVEAVAVKILAGVMDRDQVEDARSAGRLVVLLRQDDPHDLR